MTSPIPEGYHSITPSLVFKDVSPEDMKKAAEEWRRSLAAGKK